MPVIVPDTPAPAIRAPEHPRRAGVAGRPARRRHDAGSCSSTTTAPPANWHCAGWRSRAPSLAVICEAEPGRCRPARAPHGLWRSDALGAGAVRDIARLRPRRRADHHRDRPRRRDHGCRRRLGRGRRWPPCSTSTSRPRRRCESRAAPPSRPTTPVSSPPTRRRRPTTTPRRSTSSAGRMACRWWRPRPNGSPRCSPAATRATRWEPCRPGWAPRPSSGWRCAPSSPAAGPSISPSWPPRPRRCSTPGSTCTARR